MKVRILSVNIYMKSYEFDFYESMARIECYCGNEYENLQI
jgi:hypothetical protein